MGALEVESFTLHLLHLSVIKFIVYTAWEAKQCVAGPSVGPLQSANLSHCLLKT